MPKHRYPSAPIKPYTDEEILGLPPIIDAPAAARILNICVRTVTALAADGRLEAYRVGRAWRFQRDTVIEYCGRSYEEVMERVMRRRALQDELRRKFSGEAAGKIDPGTTKALMDAMAQVLGQAH